MLVNFHIHTDTSDDAVGTYEENIKSAIDAGFSEICFTNHHDWVSLINETFTYAQSMKKWKKDHQEVKQLDIKYPEIKVRFGIELGYEDNYDEVIIKFLKSLDLDFVLGSIHTFDKTFIGDSIIKEDQYEDLIEKYFYNLNKLIKLNLVDSISHLDVFIRYYPKISYSLYEKKAKDTLKLIKESDVALELNVAGWNYPPKEQNPSKKLLLYAKEIGIEKITIGSDSHNPKIFSSNIKKGIKLLKEIGFKKVCTFKKRKIIYHDL
jgi:histidinol-phosphatase (PHP family)